ncbi:epoxide hydrolase [Penicillium longicatenatum]|uniref:epoxide hydrolase n=1 Tax=Penicillium longicatenatum TaxID=1561947 RepID=UPI0025498F36|nr:epoxide hydrolase [Penicillium longicatenatum]KAJ5640114.1 epoxide hydrolase [Penicillium longicatenatum]
MASLAFPSLARKATLSDGTTYGYVAHPSTRGDGITFLLIHGYPSSCYDWRHQIKSLSAAGYGVIAPDLLGYGDTDKPTDPASYRLKSMSLHMAEILDIEKVDRCLAVGHDWGSGLLSRVVSYIPDRLMGVVFMSVGYSRPGMVWDMDKINAYFKSLIGYEPFGYWPWHNTEEAVNDCDDHPESVFTLVYPANPDDWKVTFAPLGAAAAYVKAGKTDPYPSWYTPEEYSVRKQIFAQGYRGPLNWYKAAIRGVNAADEAEIADGRCHLPTLLVVSQKDHVSRADMGIAGTKELAADLRVKSFEECGHWIQLERPNEISAALEEFAQELLGKTDIEVKSN